MKIFGQDWAQAPKVGKPFGGRRNGLFFGCAEWANGHPLDDNGFLFDCASPGANDPAIDQQQVCIGETLVADHSFGMGWVNDSTA
ncbi:MAG TPA: hypothetical protein PKE45_20865, partial [Caldilineaceae bacterium]|nr:hypothetical protein [Caldilineaceae bacterium]